MRKTITKYVLSAVLICVFCLTSCNGGNPEQVPEVKYKYDTSGLCYESSDVSFDAFINDYYSRHVRDNSSKAIGTMKQGTRGWWYNVSAKYNSFWNSTEDCIAGVNHLEILQNYLDNCYVTQYGSVNDQALMKYYYGNESKDQSYGIGWPFVSGDRTGNYSVEFKGAYNSETEKYENDTGWTINGNENAGAFSGDGFWTYTFNGEVGESLVYESGEIAASTEYAPLVEIALSIKDLNAQSYYSSSVKDIILRWKSEGNDWDSMSYYDYALYNREITSNGMIRAWFPTYLKDTWTGKIEGLKVEIVPADGEKLKISVKTNYFSLQTDTRLTTNNGYYVLAMEEYISNTGDVKMLKKHLNDIRKAVMFEIYALDGESGLLKTDYIRGKKTTVVGPDMFGLQGNGWYDCNLTGTVNFEANVVFYESLLAMINIERLAAQAGITTEVPSIVNPYPFGGGNQNISWTYDETGLKALSALVVNTLRKDYTAGGLWNPETGRFAWAIFDEDSSDGLAGEAMDYGHTEINLIAVIDGIADDNQTESIMSWIDGKRIVSGDDSQGDDIYFFKFAPRLHTKDASASSNSVVGLKQFGTDIQNGGSSIHVAYYDLLARNKVYGADNSFARLKKIQSWYEEVKSYGGKDSGFYRNYYTQKKMAEKDNQYTLAGAGTVGAVGVDYEFFEAALLYAALPTLYFGIDCQEYKVLTVEPNLPSALSYIKAYNFMFNDVVYNLKVTDKEVEISGVKQDANGLFINVVLSGANGQTVKVDGEAYSGYVYENGKYVVRVPFGNHTVGIN